MNINEAHDNEIDTLKSTSERSLEKMRYTNKPESSYGQHYRRRFCTVRFNL